MANVQVYVRCRPVLPSEVHLKRTKIECNEIDNTIRIASNVSQNTDKIFTFNKVLPETSNQEDVFEHVSPMVDSALNGLHSTIFASGQTGSGKTYTIDGLEYLVTNSTSFSTTDQEAKSKQIVKADINTPKERHGILLRIMHALFERARAKTEESEEATGVATQFRIRCSFVQLYNEKLTDLITKRGNLKLRWTSHGTFAVDGLSRSQVENPEQARELFFMAARNKQMGSHMMNQQSSRSHCIYTFYIDQWSEDTPENVIRSELSVVDLAGSEKLAMLAENPSAQLLKESIEVNTSLLALGKVITALALRSEGKLSAAQLTHVPYRESKLTKLLQHALGGNAVACMIACITPLDSYVDESMSTLMYASRARNIKNDPRVNEDPRAALIRQLREENTLLKAELAQYRQFVLDGNEENVDVASIALMKKRTTSNVSSEQNDEASAALTPSSRNNKDSSSSITSPGKSAQLAEKLLSSCAMLKEVIGVNAKLREAFDNMHQLKKKAERHEAELEAENLGLRERIELLESIALQDDGTNQSQASGASEGGGNNRQNNINEESDGASSYYSGSNQNTPVRGGGNGNRRQLTVNFSATAPVLPQQQQQHSSSAPSSATKIRDQNTGNNNLLPDVPSTPTNHHQQQIRTNSTGGYNFGRTNSAGNLIAGGVSSRPSSQDGRPSMSSTTKMTPTRPSFASNNTNNNNNNNYNNMNQQQQQRRTGSSSRPQQQQKSQKQQLREYAQKYKKPDWMDNQSYSSYYNIAKQKQKERAPGVDKTIRELSKKLPPETLSLLPSSAQKTKEFGQLAFGNVVSNFSSGGGGPSSNSGGFQQDSSVQDLEEKRRQRQERLRQLQERHKLLQQGGSSAAAMIASGTNGGGASSSNQQQQHTPSSSNYSSPMDEFYSRTGNNNYSQQQQQQPTPLYPSSSNNNNQIPGHSYGNYTSSSNQPSSSTSYANTSYAPPHALPRSLAPLSGNSNSINNNNNNNNNNNSGPTYSYSSPTPKTSATTNKNSSSVEGVFTHLSHNELQSTFTDEQLAILKRRAQNLSPKGHHEEEEEQQQQMMMPPVRGSAMQQQPY